MNNQIQEMLKRYNAAFYGGTALRIFYGLDRFSEDLDFSLKDKSSLELWSKEFFSGITKDYTFS